MLSTDSLVSYAFFGKPLSTCSAEVQGLGVVDGQAKWAYVQKFRVFE